MKFPEASGRVKHSKKRKSSVREVQGDSQEKYTENSDFKTGDRKQLKYKPRNLWLVKYY